MGELRLQFLGAPAVRHGDTEVSFPTRKALALLIYLAVEPASHTREELLALLWPQSDETRGRASLRTTLNYLRNALGEGASHTHLLVRQDSLSLDLSSGVEIDLEILGHAESEVRRLQVTGRRIPPAVDDPSTHQARKELADLLASAAGLWRGEFLAGFSLPDAPEFDDWAARRRELFHRRMTRILEALSRLQAEVGQQAAALDTASRWVALDPFDEEAYRRKMQLHMALGDRAAALRTYDSCRRVLADELGTRPDPETEALAEKLRTARQHPAGERVGQAGSRAPAALKTPFVGRAGEHSALVAAYYSAVQGQPRVVALQGEAGIGKTRLTAEFLAWATAQGADLIEARAFEASGRLPYQPLVEGLRRRLDRENAPDDLLSDIWLAELGRILPELRERYPDLPAPTADEAAGRSRLFEAVARLGAALAERSPLLLFFDDAHWADGASLDLLHYALRRWAEGGSRILVVLTLRSEAIAAPRAFAPAARARSPMVGDWLAGLERDLPLLRLQLDPLTLDDTLRLVRALAGAPAAQDATANDLPERPEHRFARWLFRETGSQPLYIVETLKALIEKGLLQLMPQGSGGYALDFSPVVEDEALLRGLLPAGIRDLIRSRLASLAPDALSLLTAAAVLGQRSDFTLLCGVAGLGPDEGLPSLDELLAANLLQEAARERSGAAADDPWPEMSYLFAHDKVRDVVYTEAGDARRRLYHRRAFELLEGAAAPAAELARHALAGGLLQPAVVHSVAAGDAAMRLFTVRDAIVHYERARRMLGDWERRGQEQPERVRSLAGHLFLQLGRAYELGGELGSARAAYEALLGLARERDTPGDEWSSLNRLATLSMQEGLDFAAATSLLEQALAVAERSGDRAGVAESEWNLAQITSYTADPGAALAHGERALALARELNLRELTARSLNVLALANTSLGAWEACEAQADEARAIYAGLDNRVMEADCLGLVAEARISMGRHAEGIAAGEAALAISLRIEDAWGTANAACHLVPGLIDAGDYRRALEIARLAVAASRERNLEPMLVFGLLRLGAVHRAALATTPALAAHLEAWAFAAKMDSPSLRAIVATDLCADYAELGEWEAAHLYARHALSVPAYRLGYLGLTRWCETEALLRAGETGAAEADVQALADSGRANPRYRIPLLRSRAVLARRRGDIDAAVIHLEEAAALAGRLELPGELWRIEAALADEYALLGDQERSGEARQRAAAVVRAIAGSLGEHEMREGFLCSAVVRQLIEWLAPTDTRGGAE